MDRLNELLHKQYKQYRQRMNYLTWYFGWERRAIWADSIKV